MPVCHLGMVRGLFVITRFVMFGGFAMVLGRVFMVIRGLLNEIAVALFTRQSYNGQQHLRIVAVGAGPDV